MTDERAAAGTPSPRPSRFPVWIGDLAIIFAVIAAAMIPVPQPMGPFGGPPDAGQVPVVPLVTAATVLAVLVVPLRRRWPLSAFAVAFGVYLLTVLVSYPVLGAGIATAVTAFSLAFRTSRATSFTAGGIGALVIALLSFLSSERASLDPQIFQIAAAVAIATALGDSARSRLDYATALAERAQRAEETKEVEAHRRVAEERLRIAQDLHDTVAHRISVISLNAGVASSALDTNPDKARESLGTIRGAARDVLGDIGVLLRYLRAEDDDALAARMPQPGLADLGPLVASMSDSGLHVDCEVSGDPDTVDETVGRVAYRVIQEALTNAHKHGSGGTAVVEVNVGKHAVTVTTVNPVAALDRNQPEAPRGGLGLTGLRERVAAVGGSIKIAPGPGEFRLVADLPTNRRILP